MNIAIKRRIPKFRFCDGCVYADLITNDKGEKIRSCVLFDEDIVYDEYPVKSERCVSISGFGNYTKLRMNVEFYTKSETGKLIFVRKALIETDDMSDVRKIINKFSDKEIPEVVTENVVPTVCTDNKLDYLVIIDLVDISDDKVEQLIYRTAMSIDKEIEINELL